MARSSSSVIFLSISHTLVDAPDVSESKVNAHIVLLLLTMAKILRTKLSKFLVFLVCHEIGRKVLLLMVSLLDLVLGACVWLVVSFEVFLPHTRVCSVLLTERYLPACVPAGVAALVRATDTPDSKFWILDSDALGDYGQPFLLWKREAYASLESQIQDRLDNFTSFIVVGTGGIGKTFFGYHWMIRLGQMGHEKVLYKVGKVVYVLNFRRRCAEGAYHVNDTIICKMLDDPSMWLVIDRKQKTPLPGSCRVLLVSLSREKNYDEFGKGGLCCMLYMSVWSREEIGKFLDDFEPYRASYGSMNVVDREKALDNLDYLGGVPRYVLRATKLDEGKARAKAAVGLDQVHPKRLRFCQEGM
ncbi:hypothetical protein SELMODRAFT_420281 [Selaginella moellendorffii]|uniref:Uncharacterized protein n=1 Tax=Selaginella moellendorffii TaxID=88036 RepID=D8SBH8_SELML|nr:hypothetical protein SELMODRAFT_420281 [Selaginella moellendorffii]